MKLLTKTNLKQMVLNAWREQYKLSDVTETAWFKDNWTKVIYEPLCDLSDDATEADIAALTGNDSWTRIECMECESSVSEAIDFGYGENRLIVCLDCLDRGIKMLLQHLDEKRKANQ